MIATVQTQSFDWKNCTTHFTTRTDACFSGVVGSVKAEAQGNERNGKDKGALDKPMQDSLHTR